jgi:transposase-like protein
MPPRQCSSVAERLALVRLKESGETIAAASTTLGFSPAWGRKWWRRYCQGGEAALAPSPPRGPGPLATFCPAVTNAVLAIRRRHPALGARRALVELALDSPLIGARLPSARTIHRAWIGAGLIVVRPPRDTPPVGPALPQAPGDVHAVWQIDHQDHLRLTDLATPVVLQSIRAPAAAVIIGAEVFPGPQGAHAIPLDDVLDGVRRCFARWGRPQVLSVDRGTHFLGQPQRSFPSRLELFCAGLGIGVVPIRPGRPTDHAGVERQHAIIDGFLCGPAFADLASAQAALDHHVAALNTVFPSRARGCAGRPPLTAFPAAHHSGRSYDPAREWSEFDLGAVDTLLAGWSWQRHVGPTTGQISFADVKVSVGKAWAGRRVSLCFDPTDRQVVIHAPGTRPQEHGPELKRFHCAAFDKPAILGASRVAWRPPTTTGGRADGTARPDAGVRPYGT